MYVEKWASERAGLGDWVNKEVWVREGGGGGGGEEGREEGQKEWVAIVGASE